VISHRRRWIQKLVWFSGFGLFVGAVYAQQPIPSVLPSDAGVDAARSVVPPVKVPPTVSGVPPTIAIPTAQATTPFSVVWPVGEQGISLEFQYYQPNINIADEKLPVIDLSEVPDGKLELRKGLSVDPSGPWVKLVAVCAVGEGSSWFSGMEAAIFEKLNQTAKDQFQQLGSVSDYQETIITEKDKQFSQNFSVKIRPNEGVKGIPNTKVEAVGVHMLGFVGEKSGVLTCSVICSEVVVGSGRKCPNVVKSVAWKGELKSIPSPSFLHQTMYNAQRRPGATGSCIFGGLFLLFGLLMVVVGVVKRNKPGPLPASAGNSKLPTEVNDRDKIHPDSPSKTRAKVLSMLGSLRRKQLYICSVV
jgi:hypothetical protein